MILIRMMNLKKLVKEFVGLEVQNLLEGTIKIPEEVLQRSDELFDFITSNMDDIVSQIYHDELDVMGMPITVKDMLDPLVLPELMEFFQFKSKYGADVSVDVGLYGGDSADARMDSRNNLLMINMDLWDTKTGKSKESLRRVINHELTHAVDPFIKHPSYRGYQDKYGADFSGRAEGPINPKTGLSARYEKYAKSQTEYAAHTSTLVEDLRNIVGDDRQKTSAAIKIISQISALPLKDQTQTSKPVRLIFQEYQGVISAEEYSDIFELSKKPEVRSWSTRPTLFKKFLKDMTTSLDRR
jgi:hypothetical protein